MRKSNICGCFFTLSQSWSCICSHPCWAQHNVACWGNAAFSSDGQYVWTSQDLSCGIIELFPRSVTRWYWRAIKASNQLIWPLELSGLFIAYQPIASWQLSHLATGCHSLQRCLRKGVAAERSGGQEDEFEATSHGAVYQQHCCIRKESIGWEGHFPQERKSEHGSVCGV